MSIIRVKGDLPPSGRKYLDESVRENLVRVAEQQFHSMYVHDDRSLVYSGTVGSGDEVIEITATLRSRVPGDGQGDGIISAVISVVDPVESVS